MVKNAGSKNKCGRLMKNIKSPNSGLIANILLELLKLYQTAIDVAS